MSASAPEIRAARAFLASHDIMPSKVAPGKFANSAKELDVGFRELLRLIGLMQDGGRGQSIQRQDVIDSETNKNASLEKRAPRKE